MGCHSVRTFQVLGEGKSRCMKTVKERVKDVEQGLENLNVLYQQAINRLIDYMERNWSKEESRAFWRAAHHDFEMATDPDTMLCGDQSYTPEDTETAMQLVEAAPAEYFENIRELGERGAQPITE